MATMKRGQKQRHNFTMLVEVRKDATTAADDAADDYGARVSEWVKHWSGYAAHYGSASKLVFFANRHAEVCTDIYVVRYGDRTKLIQADMRVVIGARDLRIVGVEDEDDRRLWIHLRCVEDKSP